MLSLADIVEQTYPASMTVPAWRSALYRYLEDPTVRELLGGQSHPSYPDSSLKKFRLLAELHVKREVTPKTLAAKLQSMLTSPDARIPEIEYSKTGQAPSGKSTALDLTVRPEEARAFVHQVGEMIAAQTVERLVAQQLPPPEDRLIGAIAAAELLCCSPRSVGRLLRRGGVEAVRPGVWKRSQVLRYIQQV